MKSYVLLASALLANSVFVSSAFADQMVTLPDGKQVLLKDDFTWQYVAPKQTEAATTTSETAAPVVAVPVATNVRGTTIVVDSKKPSLQLSQSGVDVVLGASHYEDGELIIPTAITNQSTQAVILVSVKLDLYSASSELLEEKTVAVWKSIKRMADTYLRPKTDAEGTSIKLAVEQHPEYQIKAEIVEVLTR
ncbi:DUF3157 family protein [Vibrio sp. 10N.222.54.A1]|uniref:DUF3157 family protein n=1 Tax=unclassified Vibrio TaxID=2614977 RepID=UPI000C852DAF|nr:MULTISPECIES: DUF3157 family protein [unclassified Vibrio]PMK84046.1 ribonuclease [Vibrio sp. 10N.261.52.E5]TKF81814.1 DUF3157 family protein [Vibrio sp. F13]